MAPKVNPNPSFPNAIYPNGLVSWASSFIQQLVLQFVSYGHRLNLSLPEDGSEAMTGPFQVATVAYAGLPASPTVGMLLYVSNSNTNTWGASITSTGSDKVLAWYNGSAWTVVGK